MKPSFVTPIFEEIANSIGLTVEVEPRYGYAGCIILKSGRRRYFVNTKMDINPFGASELAEDKAYASYFLKQLGYPVPKGREFFTDRWCKIIGSKRNWQAAYRYSKLLGRSVIIKPNSKSQGSGVCLVHNKRDTTSSTLF